MQKLAGEDKVSIHYVNTEDELADLGTKSLSKHRHHDFIKVINEYKT